jgi:hypothetical protein
MAEHCGLLRALGEARLVLLVFTKADADWSYCLYECGVAIDPEQGDSPTRCAWPKRLAKQVGAFIIR